MTMYKTTFRIAQMDCPSEEQMIRLKLADVSQIQSLDFDIPNRMLYVFHYADHESIGHHLEVLQLGSSWVESVSVVEFEGRKDTAKERVLLWKVFIINLFFFALESLMGWFSKSIGLIADSLDMLADAVVYGLALWSVGRSYARKQTVARLSGYLQLVLAAVGFAEVVRRFLNQGDSPQHHTMIGVSLLALLGNAACLYLLQKSKSREVHIQASMIFTSNDVIINLGVVVAGILVYWTAKPWPDWVVGSVVFVLVAQGAFKILSLAK